MKKITVTIGIPAYQSQDNIKALLKSLLKQKQENIKIEKILLYSDGSKDQTVKNAKSVKSKKITVINSKKNKGFAYALQYLISRNKSDIFVELNDDIRIDSENVIDELVKPFRLNKNVGLVGGNIKALPPKSFIGRSIYTSYLAFLPLRYKVKKGNTHLTCDGKILALSRDFARALNLKKSNVGNVDIYLYYENLRQSRLYGFAKKAEVFFRMPETIADFKSQEMRSNNSRDIMKRNFGALYQSRHNVPRFEYIKSAVSVFIKYPLESLFFKFFINKPSQGGKKTHLKWKLALTTKKLALLGFDIESLLKQL